MNRTRAVLAIVALTLVALIPVALVACSTDPSPSPGAADPAAPPTNNPQITVLDPNLQRGLGFGQSVVVPSAPGAAPMKVQVEMRNLTNFEYIVDYRFLFYDGNGLQLEPAMSWRQTSLLPKQLQMVSANALDTTASNWRLEVKWSR